MKRIVVTGVGGFIARKVAEKLVDLGNIVIGVDDFSSGYRESLEFLDELISIDLSDKSAVKQLPPKCDYILHLAGQSSGEISFDDPVKDLQKNTIATLNIIQYGISAQAKRIIYASSMSVYGSVDDRAISEIECCQPVSCYGVGKLASENYLRIYQNQIPFTIFRMFNVYGPGQDLSNLRQGMVSIYLAQALRGDTILVKGSNQRFRDFIYIDDVVGVWCDAITNANAVNKTYNLGTGVRVSVEELLSQININLPGANVVYDSGTPGDQSGIFPDVTLLKRHYKISEFISLKDGIVRFCNWAKIDA